jgi:hypothetical protein
MKGIIALIPSLIWQNEDSKCCIIECHSCIKEGVLWTKKFGCAKMCHNIEGGV